MVDYKKFLAKADEEVVVPYLGGPLVSLADRAVRLKASAPLEPGYYRFRLSGRNASPLGPADRPDLGHLPSRTGHFIGGYLALEGGRFGRLELCPETETEALAPVRARALPDGTLLFDEACFETEVELAAREALDDGRPLDDIKGVGATLRAAFAVGLALRAGRERGIAISPAEARGAIADICARGAAAAAALVLGIETRRIEHDAERRASLHDERIRRASSRAVNAARALPRGSADPIERAEEALRLAGARFLSARRLSDEQLEVRYAFEGERFVTIVSAATLQVLDAGICLAGADREVTLDSLPSVVREAVETEQLVITRR